MKLLLDHNLSYKPVGRLADMFPASEHVRNVNLHEADDRTVWEYARANGLAIVSKTMQTAISIPDDVFQAAVVVRCGEVKYAPQVGRQAENKSQPVKTRPLAVAYAHSTRWS